MRPVLSLLFLSLCGVAACGGGGGGGGGGSGGNPSTTLPADFAAVRPTGAGVAGLMDGLWSVVSVDIASDARTRNPDIDMAWFQPSELIRFRAGRLVEEDDPYDPYDPGGQGPSVPVTLEFVVNDVDSGLTAYGFGIRVGPNQYVGSGATRMVAMFGTTSPTTATAMVVQYEVYPNFPMEPVDRFMVTRLQLVKVGSLPSSLPGGAADTGVAVDVEAATEPEPAAWLRSLLRDTVRAVWRGR